MKKAAKKRPAKKAAKKAPAKKAAKKAAPAKKSAPAEAVAPGTDASAAPVTLDDVEVGPDGKKVLPDIPDE
jgi:RNA polymerase primary sigma factor